MTCNPLIFMVGQGRIELPTPGFSAYLSGNRGIRWDNERKLNFKELSHFSFFWTYRGKERKQGLFFADC